MSERFVNALEQFVETQGLDLVTFTKGQRKDDVTKESPAASAPMVSLEIVVMW